MDNANISALVAVPIALLVVPKLLLMHFRRIFRLRYQEGNVRQAMLELALWKPLLSPGVHAMLLSGMLVELKMFDSVGRLLANPKIPESKKADIRLKVHLAEKRWDLAEKALRQGIADSDGVMRTCLQLELSRLLADHFPERLDEALATFDEARRGPIVPSTTALLMTIEANLWIAGGDGAQALVILNSRVNEVAALARSSYDVLPHLATLYHTQARAHWLEGESDAAREKLIQARTTCPTPSLCEEVDTDLAKLKNGETLVPEPSAAARVLLAQRDRSLLDKWPGGGGRMDMK